MKTEFSYFHPVSTYLYFIIIFVVTVISRNPVFIVISFIGSCCFRGMLSGAGKLIVLILKLSALIAAGALINPLVSHYGATPLFFINDSAYTKEALVYGLFLSFMLAAVIIWSGCFNDVNDSEKTLYIASKFSKTMSVILSMSLRFIPMLKEKANEIKNSRRAAGLYKTDSIPERIKSDLTIISVLLTWAAENSVDTAASMKSRGFGTVPRKNYCIYKIRLRDIWLLITEAVYTILLILAILGDVFSYRYYPYLDSIHPDLFSFVFYFITLMFGTIPLFLEIKGRMVWKSLKSQS